MRGAQIAFISLFLLPFLVVAQQRSSGSSDQSKLIALENAWNQAQLDHDAAALDSLVASDFVYTDYDGTVMDRAKFLNDLKDPAFRPTLIANENVTAHMYRDSAVVFGTYHTKGSYKGKFFEHYGRFTDTWIYLDERWQCVASHTNLLRR